MNIEIVETGYLRENCYILSIDNDCLVVDPGDDYLKIKEKIDSLNVLGVLITHNHFDHVGALDELLSDYDVPVYNKSNLKEEEQQIKNFKFDVLWTPGHTSDSITFYFKEYNVMMTGDFLFHGDVGRTDLPTGSLEEMKKSIEKISKYPDNTVIYPGHEEWTTLGAEKKYNIDF